MQLIHELAEQYAARFTSAQAPVLTDVYQRSLAHSEAHMLSNQTQGMFLSMISHLVQPKYILEIGTFTGYSALCLSSGLQPGGELHSIELRKADVDNSSAHVRLAGKQNQIYLYEGKAADIIPTLEYVWDLVFIDADKTNYITYYELALERLRRGGLIIADNVLFHGQVLQEPLKGKNAKAIHDFNQHVQNDARTEQVMLTVRDGLTLIRKL